MDLTFLSDGRSGSPSALLDPSDPAILAGIEWEFLVAHGATHDHHPDDERWWWSSRGKGPDPQPESTQQMYAYQNSMQRVFAKIEDTLRDHAGLVIFNQRVGHHPNEALKVLQDNNAQLVDHVDMRYQAYSTFSDSSLHAGNSDSNQWMDTRYGWLGAEVRSRVFTEQELEDKTSPSSSSSSSSTSPVWANSKASTEINSLCRALRANMRLQINHTCALQVTISHQVKSGLDLLSLKRIATLVWLLEPLLFGLCAPYRQTRRYCLPIREHSQLAKVSEQSPLDKMDFWEKDSTEEDEPNPPYIPYWDREFTAHTGLPLPLPPSPPSTPQTPPHPLLTLWRSRTPANLSSLLRSPSLPYERLSVAIKFPSSTLTFPPAAVEFRMHEGTLDPTLTSLWLNTCVALVTRATRVSTGEYRALVGRLMDGGYDSLTMLRELGLGEEDIRLWERKMGWFEGRMGVGMEMPLPRPWAMDGVVEMVREEVEDENQRVEGGEATKDVPKERAFLSRVEDDEFLLC